MGKEPIEISVRKKESERKVDGDDDWNSDKMSGEMTIHPSHQYPLNQKH